MKKIATILILAFTLTYCTDLEIAPNSQLTDQTSYKSKSEFLNGLAGVYASLGNWSEVVYKIGGSTDEMIFPARGADWKGDLQPLYSHTWLATNGEIAGIYSGLSRNIAVSNTFIDAVDASSFKDDSDVKVMKGEARFIRAFAYFLMLDHYGNVPLVTSSVYDPNNLPKQNTRAELFNFVESEAKDLIAGALPATNSYGRVDKYAAETLLAKLYLNAGVYLGGANTHLADVVTATNDIMTNSSYSLDPSYHHVFAWDNDVDNVENIFTMVADSKNTAAENISYLFSITNLTAKYGPFADGWGGAASLPTFYKSFEPNDIRRDMWIAGPQFGSDGSPIMAKDDKGVTRQLDYVPDFTATDPVNNADHWDGVRGGKYLMDGIGGTMVQRSLNNDMPIFRFADVLMMRAEALYRQSPGSTEALSLVNQVRNRGGNPVAPFASLTDANFLAERGREFAWEGWRRNDLIRFGKYNDAWDYKAASADTHYNLFPIPAAQIQSNPNLKQNTGY
ncbi:MAG TPA: RagB/SusD family nutrient uptake outer membrane protein [Prolixibacteraceae bacterium]|jgi:hypothetical protein